MENIPISALKAGRTYAAGNPFSYVFRIQEDGDDHWSHRVKDGNMYTGENFSLVIAADKKRIIRDATSEEEQYLNSCILANKYLPIPFVNISEANYQIY